MDRPLGVRRERDDDVSDVVLEARSLVKDLGAHPVRALHEVDLVVRRGEFVAITGASGSGKSTLLYLLGALDRPTRGEVLVDGAALGVLDDDERAALRRTTIGFVFQFHFLLPDFSVLENVALPLFRLGVQKDDAWVRAREVLSRFDLDALVTRKPHELSGGQQQRVAIARAIANRPKLLLADEPTGNLDSKNATAVVDAFERLVREDGVTVVMVTHEASLAARADRRIAMRDGAIVQDERRDAS